MRPGARPGSRGYAVVEQQLALDRGGTRHHRHPGHRPVLHARQRQHTEPDLQPVPHRAQGNQIAKASVNKDNGKITYTLNEAHGGLQYETQGPDLNGNSGQTALYAAHIPDLKITTSTTSSWE